MPICICELWMISLERNWSHLSHLLKGVYSSTLVEYIDPKASSFVEQVQEEKITQRTSKQKERKLGNPTVVQQAKFNWTIIIGIWIPRAKQKERDA